MEVAHIPFQKTGFFSKTVHHYLEKKESLLPFYNNHPNLEGFKKQINEKKESFSFETRKILVRALTQQYQSFKASKKTKQNIESLLNSNTFTITTGHQLNLFTGPLYFLYKIFSAINLAEKLNNTFEDKQFVPVYWMATEDHDFEEINYFNFKGKKVSWNRESGGAVGRFSTDGLQYVLEVFSTHLGSSKNALFLKKLFSDGYLHHKNLADATRYIANELFKEYGLVIIDGDNKELKALLSPFIKDELLNRTSYHKVSETITELKKEYDIQVNPREINLFYLQQNSRERIILEQGIYKINNTNLTFSKDEILIELVKYPEKFSPNVIMRPLYQEVILPNLCYIGGGGELAYWLQLKSYFKALRIPFPILLLRNSVQIISEKQNKKLSKLNIGFEEIFLKQQRLVSKKVSEISELELSFAGKKSFLKEQFKDLKNVAQKTDITFLNAVNAQEKKQLKGLDKLEKRLLKAEKKKYQDIVERIVRIQNEMLPNQSLEERERNLSEYYLEYGDKLLQALKESLNPLQLEFNILIL